MPASFSLLTTRFEKFPETALISVIESRSSYRLEGSGGKEPVRFFLGWGQRESWPHPKSYIKLYCHGCGWVGCGGVGCAARSRGVPANAGAHGTWAAASTAKAQRAAVG